jgi:hypothetical protein
MRLFSFLPHLILVNGITILQHLYPKEISLQGLRDTKQRLQNELTSLTMPTFRGLTMKTLQGKMEVSQGYNSSLEELIILPRSFLTSEMYEKLELSLDNWKLELPIGIVGENITFPKNSQNLFLFNTTDTLGTTVGKLKNSPPFQVPSLTHLVDFYLVVPRKLFKNSALEGYGKHLVKSSISDIPIFRHTISDFKPLMVFMFESGMESSSSLKTAFNLKNYLLLASYSKFFDNFAANWINSLGHENLVSSLFCSTNANQLKESYCVKISDAKSLFWFPAFFDQSISENMLINKVKHIQKRDSQPETSKYSRNSSEGSANGTRNASNSGSESSDSFERISGADIKVEAQVLRQIHDKLNIGAIKFNDVTYELAHDPKPLIERVEERVDSKVNRFENKLKSYPQRLSAKKHQAFERLDSKEDELKENISEAKHKIMKLKGGYDYSKGKYTDNEEYENNGNWDEDEDDYGIDGDWDDIYDENCDDIYENNRDWDDSDNYQALTTPHGGIMVPISALGLDVLEEPRSKLYSQMFDGPQSLEKRKVTFTNDEDCEEITWYNVFHHSLFGDRNFCAN